jgi:WD40 repeat protein
MIKEWVGHGAQINEIRFLPEWGLFISSAEDASSRLWTADGESAGILSLSSDPTAKLRDGALAFDDQHLLTAGSGQLAVWSRNNNRTELTITIPLAQLERPGFDPMVRLPGESRILVRLGKNGVVRALVVRPDGSLVQELGLPPLVNLKALAWTRDGSRLAWTDARQVLHVARYEGNGWQEDKVAANVTGLSRIALSPDGTRFAAVRAGKGLVVGSWDGTQWALGSDIPLSAGSLDQGLIQWTTDSSRFVYAQSGQVQVRNPDGRLLHSFQAFPGTEALDTISLGKDPNVLALGLGTRVRVIDLRLEALQAQLCRWLDAWVNGPDAPAEFSNVCRP